MSELKAKRARIHREVFQNLEGGDAFNKMPYYLGNSNWLPTCVHLPTESYTEELDKHLTAVDNIKEEMTEYIHDKINEKGTILQVQILNYLLTGLYTYQQIGDIMDLHYFSIYSAIYGQKQGGKMVGGLMKKLQKCHKEPRFKELLDDLQKIYKGDQILIEKYYNRR